MVWPDILVTTSPGLVAPPLGIFSAAATMPTTLSFKSISAIAFMVPTTLAAPHISYFISSILAPGFKLIPPVSKVTPLPTSTCGCALFLPPLYSITIRHAGWSLPALTDSRAPMPSCFIFFSSSTLTVTDSNLRPRLRASLAM